MSRYTGFLSAGGLDGRLEIMVRLPQEQEKSEEALGSLAEESSVHFHSFPAGRLK